MKTWFITGTSKGFGRVWAEAALKRGDTVAATARKVEALDDLVRTYGDLVLPLALDVTDKDAAFAASRPIRPSGAWTWSSTTPATRCLERSKRSANARPVPRWKPTSSAPSG